tara:strand:- start:2034 stop:2822 length:789 start_codon:yes stop_codon:yes gene_type:complete
MGISLLCAVKITDDEINNHGINRQTHLLRSYPSWIECEGVDEIVIVDWGSDTPVSEVLEKHDKLKIIRVNPSDCKYWSFSQAFNLAARFSSCEHFVFINADEIILDKYEISKLDRPDHTFFYEGTCWDDKRAHGVYFLYISKELFWHVNAFNEKLIGYGYDDVDIRKRLEASGARLVTPNVQIEHIPHGHSHEGRENGINYGLSKYTPWTDEDSVIDIRGMERKDGVLCCGIEEKDVITEEKMKDRQMVLVFICSVNLPWLY